MLEKDDIDKIEKINRDIMYMHESFTSKGSKTYGAYLKMASHATNDGALSKMNKELIAVGISVCINCEPCTVWHVREALRAGAKEEMIIEAIEVAAEMGGGPTVARSSFALKVLEHLKGQSPT
ncbi:MAG: carboxymuconolactone decarboxylase family protein [Smithella sp.]|jgi:AhpD family alkylhydroperoxidase